MSKITVNGESQDVTLPLSLTELIKENRILQPDMVSIQVNGAFVLRENYDSTLINEGDEVDFLYFMGGGQ
ncbi:MAG: sulfur carrier protein ThiS [Tannerella sp.]|jgi:sulfur carrier protein|nr:sulfur carrier protein ThiS [Tannerella sp.]